MLESVLGLFVHLGAGETETLICQFWKGISYEAGKSLMLLIVYVLGLGIRWGWKKLRGKRANANPLDD